MTRSLLDGILTGTRYGVQLYDKGESFRARLYSRSTGRTILFSHSPVEHGSDDLDVGAAQGEFLGRQAVEAALTYEADDQV